MYNQLFQRLNMSQKENKLVESGKGYTLSYI